MQFFIGKINCPKPLNAGLLITDDTVTSAVTCVKSSFAFSIFGDCHPCVTYLYRANRLFVLRKPAYTPLLQYCNIIMLICQIAYLTPFLKNLTQRRKGAKNAKGRRKREEFLPQSFAELITEAHRGVV